MDRCNSCGIPEKEWKDSGICTACGNNRKCYMDESLIIPQRVFDYASKHGLLDMGSFFHEPARRKLSHKKNYRKTPKYMRDACSCDGMQFDSLSEFPKGKVLRVCREGKNKDFLVGDIVWRSKKGIDGINFYQEAGCLDAEFCDEALKGVHFEIAYEDIPAIQKEES